MTEIDVVPATAENILGLIGQPPNIFQRIEEIAVRFAPDYPNIKTVRSYEQLWAIEQTLSGKESALNGWHELVKLIQTEYGISDDKILSLWDKVERERKDCNQQ